MGAQKGAGKHDAAGPRHLSRAGGARRGTDPAALRRSSAHPILRGLPNRKDADAQESLLADQRASNPGCKLGGAKMGGARQLHVPQESEQVHEGDVLPDQFHSVHGWAALPFNAEALLQYLYERCKDPWAYLPPCGPMLRRSLDPSPKGGRVDKRVADGEV